MWLEALQLHNLQRGDKAKEEKKYIYIYLQEFAILNVFRIFKSHSSSIHFAQKKISIKFRSHCDVDTSRASHHHSELNSAVKPTKVFSPLQPTEFLVSLKIGDEITDYLAG
jgi:hypothetical protein